MSVSRRLKEEARRQRSLTLENDEVVGNDEVGGNDESGFKNDEVGKSPSIYTPRFNNARSHS